MAVASLAFGLTLGCGGGGGASAPPSPSLTLVSPTSIQATVYEGESIPSPTITVQAAGDLNSLAGKQIYVGIVDPDSLFSLSVTPSLTPGPNNTYSLILPGQALNVLGTYHGNLQIMVSTSSSFTSQLGNCPLSLPYSVTVAAAPPSATGSFIVNNLLYNAGSGTMTLAPTALTPSILRVVRPDGSLTTGTFNSATGAFTIPHVPIGNYFLHLNDSYIWTSSRSVNMDWTRGGRYGYLDGNSTLRTFALSNLTAWESGDYLLGFDYNSGLYRSWSNVSNGATSVDSTLSWQGWPLIDTTVGDAPCIVQYATSTNGTVKTTNPVASGNLPSVHMFASYATNLAVPLTTLTATDSVFVNFRRSQFAGYRSAYNTNATVTNGPFFEVDSTPGAATYGNAGEWLDGYVWQDTDSANTTDVNLGNQPTPPVPAGFDRIYYAGETHYLSLTAPGASSAYTYTVKGIRSYTLTPPSGSAPLEALVSPVTSPKINGNSLFQDQTGVGQAPTLSWTAPSLGSPNLYVVTIYHLTNSGGTTQSAQLCRLFLPGTATSVTLPPGILQTGNAYTFLITANVDAGYDLATAPWGNHRFPYGYSQCLSNRVMP